MGLSGQCKKCAIVYSQYLNSEEYLSIEHVDDCCFFRTFSHLSRSSKLYFYFKSQTPALIMDTQLHVMVITVMFMFDHFTLERKSTSNDLQVCFFFFWVLFYCSHLLVWWISVIWYMCFRMRSFVLNVLCKIHNLSMFLVAIIVPAFAKLLVVMTAMFNWCWSLLYLINLLLSNLMPMVILGFACLIHCTET